MKQIQRKLNVGLIGLGHQAMEDHLPAIKASQDVQLVGVVDVDKRKLKDFVKANKGVHIFERFEDLFKSEKLDFVIIATPHFSHSEIVQCAIRNKVHVLKEKPFAISLAQAKKIHNLAIQNCVIIGTTLQRRFNPIYSTFFQFIDKIGQPYFIDCKYTFYTDAPYEGWRGSTKFAGGGCLIDMGYHMIDLLMWYFGLPDLIFAETSCKAVEKVEYDAEDTAKLIFRYIKKEILGSMLISRVIPPKTEYLDVYGTRGIIHLERGKIERRFPNGDIQESLQREQNWQSASLDQLNYFVKVIRGEMENITNPEFHFNHLALIEAAYRSNIEAKAIDPHILL